MKPVLNRNNDNRLCGLSFIKKTRMGGGHIYWSSLGKCGDLVLACSLGSTRRVLTAVLVTSDLLGRWKYDPSVSMTTKEPAQTMGRF